MHRLEAIFLSSFILTMLLISCTKEHKHANSLIDETSPYLLQHAHNPVNWYAWNKKTLEKAKKENKLILISIGYSSCHWCHVMEKESFENEEVAKVMNDNFINIKVDREERPDVDNLYVNAVQLMTGSAGWPLNCIALPDGQPIWGGTYFDKETWLKSITKVLDIYEEKPNKIHQFAENIAQEVKEFSWFPQPKSKIQFSPQRLDSVIQNWKSDFDNHLGGYKNQNEKFPSPNQYDFLMRYSYQTSDEGIKIFVNLTLKKIALGGMNDPIDGGFSRYSTDKNWQIPHFEKMLYDNAQLISLYSKAFQYYKEDLFKETVYNTISFIDKQMTSDDGSFYSSYDADSFNENNELEEGQYYTWNISELESLIEEDFEVFSDYYNIDSGTNRLDEKIVLIRDDIQLLSKKYGLTLDELKSKIEIWKIKLIKAKENRAKPRRDEKILTSWNALQITALTDAYLAFQENTFLDTALKNANFIKEKLFQNDGTLYRNFNKGRAKIDGYLDDYAFLIQAFIKLYQASMNEEWLTLAKSLTDKTISNFYNKEQGLFYYTDYRNEEVIIRTINVEDNAISSGNSVMAMNLFLLSHYFDETSFLQMSEKMLRTVMPRVNRFPSAYSTWLELYSNFAFKFYEIAISGPEAKAKLFEIKSEYKPNKLTCASTNYSDLALLQNRYVENQTMIYVCVNKTCNLPTPNAISALEQLTKN